MDPMEPASDRNFRHPARRFAFGLAAATVVMPLLGLAGWWLNLPLLASFGDQFIPMAPSTAAGFILMSAALSLALRSAPATGGKMGVGFLGGLVGAYGFLVFVSWLAGLPVNPDDLWLEGMGMLSGHAVGRMSAITGGFFCFAGISLLALLGALSRGRRSGFWLWVAVFSGFVVFLGGAVFSLGYTLRAPLLYESDVIPLALPTAVSFLLLGGGLTVVAALYNPSSGRWYRALDDMQIGTQLRLGLGCILGFVVFLGVLAWMQTGLVWSDLSGLYEHPLQVRQAVGDVNADVLTISLAMKDACLAENDRDRQAALQRLDASETDAHRQFDVLFERYLGPRSDVEAAHQAFVQWRAVREETLWLLRTGKRDEALRRVKASGLGGEHVEKILGRTRTISEFAKTRGDQFYETSTKHRVSLKLQLTIIVGAILALSLGIGHLLLRGIRRPLRELVAVTDQYRQGRLQVRSPHVSANEFGALADAFNRMAEAVEVELHLNENAAKLAAVMLRKDDLHAFCRELLQELLEHTGSQIGAVYVLNGAGTSFELCESIGLDGGRRAAFSATEYEGEFGAVLAARTIRRITDIPEDSRFTFATAGGEFKPREIITIPILSDHKVAAVVSLASIRNYSIPAIRLVEETWGVMTARVNGVLAFRQLRALSERLDHQNRELAEQKKELSMQAGELTEQNTELEVQKQQLMEANRLKGTFLSNMSHELRTPLNSVIALTGVLNRRLAGTVPEEEHGYLEIIERNGKHLLSLINDILDLSRIEAGRADISLSRFPVRTLVDEVAAMIEPQAREKGIALVSETADDLPTVTSDYDKCRHILQNLVGNAVKFTETGAVKISARRAGDSFCVEVRDTGIGITPRQLSHIFDEFRQGDESTSRKYGGAGLGLAIAKKYAELLHGAITVESVPGQGSAFTLTLPLAITLPDADAAEDYGGTAAPGGLPPALVCSQKYSTFRFPASARMGHQLVGAEAGNRRGYCTVRFFRRSSRKDRGRRNRARPWAPYGSPIER